MCEYAAALQGAGNGPLAASGCGPHPIEDTLTTYAIYVPVGPGSAEISRLLDLLDSLRCWAEGAPWIILVDDAAAERHLAERACSVLTTSPIVLDNPRKGLGNGSTGGLCVSDLTAFKYIQQETNADFVLKLDTDSLVVKPFAGRICNSFENHPAAGMIGVVGDSFLPDRTFYFIRQVQAYYERLVSFPGDIRKLDATKHTELRSLRPEERAACERLRPLVDQVMSLGRDAGRYCQGGAYAVSRPMLNALKAAGHLEDPLPWKDLRIGEDIFVSTLCAAVDMDICDASQPGDAFAIDPGQLPYSPSEILALNRSIFHSLKGLHEDQNRRWFQNHRNCRLNEL